MIESPSPEILTPAEAARYMGMSLSWLAQARMRNAGPSFIRLGRSVRYRRSVLEAWLEEHVCPTQKAAQNG